MIPPYNIKHVSKMKRADQVKLMADTLLLEEKVDGFSIYFTCRDGYLDVATKQRQGVVEDPGAFVEILPRLQELYETGELNPDYTYYGEYLDVPHKVKHAYARAARGGIIIWDIHNHYILDDPTEWLDATDKATEAHRLGFETPNSWYAGLDSDRWEMVISPMLNQTSFLGGTKVEGIIIKNYSRLDKKGFPLTGKVVRE